MSMAGLTVVARRRQTALRPPPPRHHVVERAEAAAAHHDHDRAVLPEELRPSVERREGDGAQRLDHHSLVVEKLSHRGESRAVAHEQRAHVQLRAAVEGRLRDCARAEVVPVGGVDVRRRRRPPACHRPVQQVAALRLARIHWHRPPAHSLEPFADAAQQPSSAHREDDAAGRLAAAVGEELLHQARVAVDDERVVKHWDVRGCGLVPECACARVGFVPLLPFQ
mmetsp:Transcript_30036/g.96098  ORF Transcript_30036/g.96098 Transcript_30036/m.96098 type:complete len:224 (-) Transcript_30036:396-1067(-)